VITTKFMVVGGDSISHDFSFDVTGPSVSVSNINSLIVDVKPHSGKRFPITLKNNSDVDAEVLFLYSKYNNYQFNYHFLNQYIPDEY